MHHSKEQALSNTFHKIHRMFMNNVKQEANLIGINPTYHYIFMNLHDHKEGLSQSELCDLIHLKAPSVSLLLQQMEKEELILREKSSNDNRLTIVKLTEKGKKLDSKLKQIFKKNDELMNSSLNDEEMNNLKLYLNKIMNKLKGEDKYV